VATDRAASRRNRFEPGSIAEIGSVGDHVIAEAIADAPIGGWPLLDVGDLFLTAAMDEQLSPTAGFELAISYLAHLVDTGDYTDATVAKASGLIARFVKYSELQHGVADVREFQRHHARAFIDAPVLGDELRSPASRTKENRRWAIDLFFKTLRGLGLYDGDPLLDSARLARSHAFYRPLLDTEIERCRGFTRIRSDDTIGPARWALAEATGTDAEIPRVLASDYDRTNGRVWLPSGKRGLSRWGYLTPWGVDAVEHRIAALRSSDPAVLAYEGRRPAHSQQAAVSATLRRVLNRAGLALDKTVRPSSVRAWAGLRVYHQTQDIQEVALRLGLHSLDDARRTIALSEHEHDEPPPHRKTAT
jgi:hypothetical protein